MMSGPLPASTAAAVLGCSWSPVTVSMVTWTLFASENSLAWRLISASAAGTKLTHWRRRICAPALGLGIAPAGVGEALADGLPPHAAMSGPADSPAAARPVVLRNSRRLQTGPLSPIGDLPLQRPHRMSRRRKHLSPFSSASYHRLGRVPFKRDGFRDRFPVGHEALSRRHPGARGRHLARR